MFRDQSSLAHRGTRWVTVAAFLFVGVAAARVQSAGPSPSGTAGQIDFSAADLPPATVEVDLTQGIFGDLFGLGGAALSGISDSLSKSVDAHGDSDATKKAVEQLAAAEEIVQLAKEVVHEVRVRIYEDNSSELGQADSIASRFDEQMRAENWDNVVRIRDGKDSVRVSFLREAGSVRGVLVVAADGSDVVLVNVVCDVSPENVKKITSAATEIGLKNGLQQLIEQKMKHMH